jgi:hypothetical protein
MRRFISASAILAVFSLLAFALGGCSVPPGSSLRGASGVPMPPDLDKKIFSAENPERPKPRFSVESHGVFRAGYDDNKREILVVTDAETGIQYLSITGCGTTELRSERSGKSTATRER